LSPLRCRESFAILDLLLRFTTATPRRADGEGVAHIDQLDDDGLLSDHEVFRSYIQHARYALPEDFPDPRSIIALAVDTKLMKATFHRDGRTYDVLVPPQYYSTGMDAETLEEIVSRAIVEENGHKIARLTHGHMKLLAVRTGLGRYGRNNICYVDGMGTFLALYAFVTDYEFENDGWTDVKMMDACSDCRVCRENCPTGAIPDDGFVLDAGKCIPLYNEVDGVFPEWLSPDAHNALVGCMRCQLPCPENRQPLERAGRLPDISEDETEAILSDAPEEAVLKSAADKLRIDVTNDELRAVIARNLRTLLGE
jgi:epoxyqueuosine reductase